MDKINFEVITIEDCLEMYQKKNKCVILNDGRVLGFQEEDNKC